jgi:hypothetical protein
MALWPTSIATNADLYIALDDFSTSLNGAINNSQTTITLASTVGLPTVGILTIESEKIKYTGVSGNDITGCTRGFSSTTAASHVDGTYVALNVVEEHHNSLKDEIIALETSLNFTASRAMTSDVSGRLAVSAVTSTELGYVSGVTSAIQTQLNGKEPTITTLSISKGGTNSSTALNNNRVMQSSGGSIVEAAAITASRALISDANGIPTHSTVTTTELGYVSGVTSAIQTQLNAKATDSLVVHLAGTETITGAKTFSSTLTMSGATIAMGSNKITGLANGTAATDAAAFGQIYYGFQATVTSSTFQNTNLSASITPTSSSHRIKITIAGGIEIASAANIEAFLSVFRGSTDLGSAANTGFAIARNQSGTSTSRTNASISYIDSPATTSSTTYTVKLRNSDNSTTVKFPTGDTEKAVIILEEIV